jgi:hypothetical protein
VLPVVQDPLSGDDDRLAGVLELVLPHLVGEDLELAPIHSSVSGIVGEDGLGEGSIEKKESSFRRTP